MQKSFNLTETAGLYVIHHMDSVLESDANKSGIQTLKKTEMQCQLMSIKHAGDKINICCITIFKGSKISQWDSLTQLYKKLL